MTFRFTVGENGTAFGKQTVLFEDTAENAFEFAKRFIYKFEPNDQRDLINSGWVDAEWNTIPIAVMNLNIEPTPF